MTSVEGALGMNIIIVVRASAKLSLVASRTAAASTLKLMRSLSSLAVRKDRAGRDYIYCKRRPHEDGVVSVSSWFDAKYSATEHGTAVLKAMFGRSPFSYPKSIHAVVDAIFVGPNDLSAQMRGPDGLDPSPAAFEAMLQRILAAGKKTGTPVGLHVQSIEDIKRRTAEGWQFIAIGSELRFMTVEAQKITAGLDLKRSADLARY